MLPETNSPPPHKPECLFILPALSYIISLLLREGENTMLRKWGGGSPPFLSPQAEMNANLRVTYPLHAIPNPPSASSVFILVHVTGQT